jgi:predicted P-loop ATPase
MPDEKIVQLPVPVALDADDRVHADDRRNQRLFDWARGVLKRLGLDRAIAQARTIDDLHRVALDLDDGRIALEIRDALHPVSGERQEHFRGLSAGSLKQILKNQFRDLKKDREDKLKRRGRASQEDWTEDLMRGKRDEIIANLHNVILILRNGARWKGVLAFDEFATRVELKKDPPFATSGTAWTDHYETLTRTWFQRQEIKVSQGDIGRAVQAAARSNPFHPVREYLEGPVWDGTSRIDTWLIVYFSAEDTAYVRAIGSRWLISAVARIYRPGCQADHALVFEGPQGRLKSSALRTLAVRDAWFADRLSRVGTKDAHQELAGAWIVELAEMDCLNKATASAKKAFLTERFDRYRPPYGRHVIDRPRQNVFAGTINPPVGGYLTDSTGNRRYWPLACLGDIDRAGLERDRDQLWAEAVQRFKAGAPWHLETKALEALATAEQDTRFIVDLWEKPIRKWLGDRDEVALDDVLEHALGFPVGGAPQAAVNRAARVLTRLEFRHFRPAKRGDRKRPWLYRRDLIRD